MDKPTARFAVIDLGTNTFHLLIVQPSDHENFEVIYRQREYVKLAASGIHHIDESAFQRGIHTLNNFAQLMQQYGVRQYKAIGTAALRTAENGLLFIQAVKKGTGLDITLISGEEEAYLIWKGVQQKIPFSSQPQLIIDIGGGSVEGIIAKKNEVLFSKSFPVGVAILKNRFHQTEPISPIEIQKLYDFLTQQFASLIQEVKNHQVKTLIGAAGNFEVLAQQPHLSNPSLKGIPSISIATFQAYSAAVIAQKLEERLQNPVIPTQRADMIVVALLLIKFILSSGPIEHILVSSYALKEGVITDLLAIDSNKS